MWVCQVKGGRLDMSDDESGGRKGWIFFKRI